MFVYQYRVTHQDYDSGAIEEIGLVVAENFADASAKLEKFYDIEKVSISVAGESNGVINFAADREEQLNELMNSVERW